MLRLSDVKAYYQTPRALVKAVDGVTFDVRENEVLGIAGESGCGKSTLLKVLYDAFRPPLRLVSFGPRPDKTNAPLH
ncbi:MAG TPA: ATP-binding cassette domain-containing protein [Chthoniobacterales bacterium]|nr:ATP-binding cassette domain-containing protein [Chthoniobacterales bacterium]